MKCGTETLMNWWSNYKIAQTCGKGKVLFYIINIDSLYDLTILSICITQEK
jgi:hypothetical protein